jgi:hypothetical protein
MRRDRDPLDWLLAVTIGPFIARWHRGRVQKRDEQHDAFAIYYGVADWHRENPGRCMYCAYTRWANEEHGQKLKIGVHRCREGNSPPMPLPKARVLP